MSYIEQLQQDTMLYRPRITYNTHHLIKVNHEEEPTVAMPHAQHYDQYKTIKQSNLCSYNSSQTSKSLYSLSTALCFPTL